MLRHRADCTDSQRAASQNEPKIDAAHGSLHVHSDSGVLQVRSGFTRRRSRPGRGGESIGEKIQIARAREHNPLGNGEEHDQDEYSNDFKGVPPTNALNQAVNQKGRNCTAYA